MVQMKAAHAYCRTETCKLYIPHGSDERRTDRDCQYDHASFISHMVQMKDECMECFAAYVELYIPHGSDERRCVGCV